MNFNFTIKKIFALGCLMIVCAAWSNTIQGQCTELFFSEYIEGSGNNKCIEIYNPTSAAIDLEAEGYTVVRFSNGSTNGTTINLTGMIASGDVHVVCNPGSTQGFLDQADQTSGSASWNGDDAIALQKGGVNIDVFGQIGFDPGSQWEVNGVGTQNQTLVRMSSISAGDPNGMDAFDPSAEWVQFPQDNLDDLGNHTSDTCPIVVGCDELFFSEYIEGSSNNKCIEIYNPTAAAIDLAAGAYSVVRFSNGSTNGTTINLTGTVASGDVYVLCNPSSAAEFLAQADQTSGSANWNGDDAIALQRDGVNIDVFGQIGFDPGSQWEENGVETQDQTLVRMATVLEGDSDGSDAFDPSAEWIEFPQNTVANLGSHTSDCIMVSCMLSSVVVSNISPCDNNGTDETVGDDTFTFDVTVTFADAPATGSLDISGSAMATVPVAGLDGPTMHMFTGIVGTADGGPLNITASFSDETTCNGSDNTQMAPEPCSFNPCGDLFFSEYVEGSGLNKCVEIYNPTANPIDLAAEGYTVNIAYNGATAFGTTIDLVGTVGPGCVFVLCDDGAGAAFLALADQTATPGFWNGDDAVVLQKAGADLDVIGQVGNDPGSEWLVGGVGTANETIRRIASVDQGDATRFNVFDPSAEWVSFPNNSFDDLGNHQTACIANNPPVIACPADVTIGCDEDTTPANTGMATATDDCNDPEVTFVDVSTQGGTGCDAFSYTITRTWTATDAAGSAATCTQIITVEDLTPPSINCPADVALTCTESTDPTDTGMATGADECLGATDVTISFTDISTQSNEGCSQFTYTINRTWSATDACGNTSSCVQVISVSDTEAPVITCPAGQVLSCFETIPSPFTNASDFLAAGGTISDNCTSALTDFTVFASNDDNGGDNCPGNGGVTVRTYFVSDACGNQSTCTQTFTYLESTQGPVITSVLPTCFKYCASLANPMEEDITFDTDCNFGGTVNITGPTQIGQDNCPGTIYRYTYIVTDDCGRTSAPVTRDFIIGNDGPTIECAPFNLILECGDENNQDYIDAHLATATANSACELGVTLNYFPQNFNLISCNSSTVVTFVATDACGRTASCTTTIAVQDNTAPEFTFEPTLSCDVIECGADAQFFFQKWINSNIDSLEATDACDTNVSISAVNPQLNQNCNADGEAITVVTFAATDNCNNSATFTRTFTIENTAPAFFTNVPADATVECTGVAPTFGPAPTVLEQCQTTVTTMDSVDDTDPCAVLYIRTWTATDACGGLTTSVSQTITAIDTQAPVAPAAPANLNVQCANDLTPPVDLTANDACQGNITVSPSAVITPGSCDNDFVMVRTWTFVDACGNESSVSQTLTVNDDTAPVAPAAPAGVNIQCASDLPPPVDLTATDNCGESITVSPSAVITPGDCEDQFTMVRTWTFVDMCGNESSVSQTITVFDDTAPTFTFVPADYEGPCVDADGNATVYAQVCSSSDDAEEDESNGNEGEMNLTSSDLELSFDNSQNKNVKVGVRFKDLNIPAGATITSAYIQFTADATIDIDPSELNIYGDDTDNALTFTTEDFNISDRPATDATVTWNPGDWLEIGDNLEVQRTPDLTSIVQELVDRAGFTPESAMAFIIEGIGKRTAISYDLNPEQAPELYVTYNVGEIFGTPTVTDNCSNVTLLFEDEIVPGCDGSITRTWIALDDCGNSEVATQTVNFTGDNVPPVFTFVPASGYDDCDFVTFPPAFGTPIAEDNCGGVVDITFVDYFYEGDEESCDNDEDYEYRREWTATDDCGNTTTAVQNWDVNGNDYSSFTGFIYTEEEAPVEDVQVTLTGANGFNVLSASGGNGTYGYNSLTVGGNYTVTPALNTDPLNGVSSFDLVLISKHILQLQTLDSPYKLIAADINRSGSITTMDLVQLRKLILHIDEDFANNTSWRFIEANYSFPQPNNPFATIFPEETFINGLVEGSEQNYVGVKIGDVNGNAVANSFAGVESRSAAEDLTFVAEDATLAVDETYEMVVRASDFNNVIGYQFTMNFDAAEMEFVGMTPGALPELNEANFGFTKANEGAIMTSWTNDEAISMDADAALFTLTFKAKKALTISEALSISSRYTKAEAYNAAAQMMEVGLRFEGATTTAVANNVFALYQNQPNPFKSSTTIGFELPEAAAATLSIHDVSGRLLKQIEGDFVKGYNEVSVEKSDLQATGVVYYRLVTADFEATKKMMIVK